MSRTQAMTSRRSRTGRPFVLGVLAATMMLGLSACQHTDKRAQIMDWNVADPSQRHPITVAQAPVFLDVEVPPGSSGLTKSQRSRVRHFLREYRAHGEGPVLVATPSGSHNESAAFRALAGVHDVARSQGIPEYAVAPEPYGAMGDDYAPLKISYMRYTAKAPECGKWPENLARTRKNVNYHNFGCAAQQNLAAMVANPRDLLGPQAMDPRAAERGDVHWRKYIQGESTGAEKSEEEKAGNISEVGQN